ncbi:helical backbone metal receptor [Spirosoma sp. SC4-14]|uniref:ABC transporter substrate-binding protein n=1 Tax=Spirosoma sp. SC4-14 TaxID=3128900 RepID=UPI0030D1258F
MAPQRIISLVPSQTELLFDLGLDAEIAGITKFCIHPADKVHSKPSMGGTKTLHMDRIHALKPDLIIANKEENTRQEVEYLQQQYPVYVSDVATIADALTMIREIGTLVGKRSEADALANQISQTLYPAPQSLRKTVAYFIWRKPYMAAASHTFIDSMLTMAGFTNVFAAQTRYPEINPETLSTAQPDLIFLSSEPYPFTQKHIDEFKAICPSATVVLVDGEVFSWYGSRLLRASDYFRNLHTEIVRQQS